MSKPSLTAGGQPEHIEQRDKIKINTPLDIDAKNGRKREREREGKRRLSLLRLENLKVYIRKNVFCVCI